MLGKFRRMIVTIPYSSPLEQIKAVDLNIPPPPPYRKDESTPLIMSLRRMTRQEPRPSEGVSQYIFPSLSPQ